MHGWGGSIESFRCFADRFAKEYRVTLIDLYGFGRTPHPEKPLCLNDYARGVREILDREEIEDAVLIGHSFGGRVAMRLAASDRRIRSLVLIDSAGAPPRRGIKYHAKVWAYKIKKKCGIRVKRAGSLDYQSLSGAMKATFLSVVNDNNLSDCKKIDVPVLLLWGKEDRDTPLYMCKKLKRCLSESEAIVIEGAGHFSYLEKPEYAYRVVRAFLKSV